MNPIKRRQQGGPKIAYLIRDDYNDTLAAGAVNGTLSTPGGQANHARIVTDTTNKLSVGSGVVTFSGGKPVPAWGDPMIKYANIARVAGRTMFGSMVASTRGYLGWDAPVAGITSIHGFSNLGAQLRIYDITATISIVGAITVGVMYQYAIVMRSSGAFYFVKGGTEFPYWNLVAVLPNGVDATMYPAVTNFDAVFNADSIRVMNKLWLPLPIMSDSFNRANGALGNTDGLGHAEANGGYGKPWTDQIGTWGISGNVAKCSALAGGIGAATVLGGTGNVLTNAALTRVGGNVGIVFRYTDSSNYAYAYHDGVNATVRQIVGGVDTAVVGAAAAAYADGRSMTVHTSGTACRLYYNNLLVGAGALNAALTAPTYGLYTTNVNNSMDDFVVWARGTNNEYSEFDKPTR